MAASKGYQQDLIDRAKRGDVGARGELLGQYRNALRNMVRIRLDRGLAARVDPSDIVQEALAEAVRRFDEFFAVPDRSFYPWLRRIAWDRLVDAYRTHVKAEKRSVRREVHRFVRLNDDSVAELATHLAASESSPTRRLMQREMILRVRQALDRLAPHDKELLVLRHLEQLGVREIAEVLGISETAVTTRHLRALQRLRKLLDEL